MKLLILENSDTIPPTLAHYIHDNQSHFSSIHKAFYCDQLDAETLKQLIGNYDAIALQSAFIDKSRLEQVTALFTTSLAPFNRIKAFVGGFTYHLNAWEEYEATIGLKTGMLGFADYATFRANILTLIQQGRLFSIQQNETMMGVVDHRYTPDGREEYFTRFPVCCQRIRYHKKNKSFYASPFEKTPFEEVALLTKTN